MCLGDAYFITYDNWSKTMSRSSLIRRDGETFLGTLLPSCAQQKRKSGPKFVIVRARAPKGVASFEETAVDLCTLDRGQASARLQLLGRRRGRSGKPGQCSEETTRRGLRRCSLWLSLTRLSHPSVTESPALCRMEGSRAMIWKAVVVSHCAPRSTRRRWNCERRPSSARRWTMSAIFETRFVSTRAAFSIDDGH